MSAATKAVPEPATSPSSLASASTLALNFSPVPSSIPAPVLAPVSAQAPTIAKEENPHLVPQATKAHKWQKPAWTNRGKDVPVAQVASSAKSSSSPNSQTAQGGHSTGAVKQVIGRGVAAKVAGLQAGGMRTTAPTKRRMKTPKIVTDTKETRDKFGNITREITRYITEPDGSKRTEKETVHISAK